MNPGNYKWYTKEEVASWPEGHKQCRTCQEVLPLSDFHKQKQTLFGVNNHCKNCRKPASKALYAGLTFERSLYDSAKSRATMKDREFTIRLEDIVIPEECPILGVPIIRERNSPYAPSLDRIDSSKGYTPENIQVVSKRANTLKNNMSAYEGVKLVEHLTNSPFLKEYNALAKLMSESMKPYTKIIEALKPLNVTPAMSAVIDASVFRSIQDINVLPLMPELKALNAVKLFSEEHRKSMQGVYKAMGLK